MKSFVSFASGSIRQPACLPARPSLKDWLNASSSFSPFCLKSVACFRKSSVRDALHFLTSNSTNHVAAGGTTMASRSAIVMATDGRRRTPSSSCRYGTGIGRSAGLVSRGV